MQTFFNVHQLLLFLFDALILEINVLSPLLPVLPVLIPVLLPVLLPLFFLKYRQLKLLLFQLVGPGTLFAKQFSNFLFQVLVGPVSSAFHPLVDEGVVPVLDHVLCSSAIELLGNLRPLGAFGFD